MRQHPWSPLDRERFAEQRLRAQTVPAARFDGPTVDEWDAPVNGAAMDPFDDDTPIVAVCDLENPESCESCS